MYILWVLECIIFAIISYLLELPIPFILATLIGMLITIYWILEKYQGGM